MKTQLILLEQPIIVSDEEIKEGNHIFYNDGDRFGVTTPKSWSDLNSLECIDSFKIIASENLNHNLPSIDWNGLEEEFGYIDVEKIISEELGYNEFERDIRVRILNLSKRLKKCQELNEKKYSLEDIKRAYRQGEQSRYSKTGEAILEKEFIQSIQKPKVFDIEIEMELIIYPANMPQRREERPSHRPKITNNKIKILKKL